MRSNVRGIWLVVSIGGIDALHLDDIVLGHWDEGSRRDPILWARMAVTQFAWRESGDNIIGVGDAVQGAAGLCGQEFRKSPVSDAGSAI